MKPLGLGLPLLAAIFLIAAPAEAKKKTDYVDQFKAIATRVQAGAGGMDIVRFAIKEWTTAEEREDLIKAFDAGGSDALYEWLDKQGEKAVVFDPDGRPYTLMYAFEAISDGQRTIVLGTNRPISGLEQMVGTQQSTKYNISFGVLRFKEGEKKGTGEMVLGAKIGIDKKTNKLVIEGMGLQPIRFTSVTDVQKNKKK